MALDDSLIPSGDAEDEGSGTVGGAKAGPFPRSDAEVLAGAEPLPCGRPLGPAWEQARDPVGGSDPHTARCPYCREAVEGMAALDRATRALRAAEQPDSKGLVNRVVDAVRAEVRLGAALLLDDPGRDLRIAESTAAKVLRQAADSVPGMRAASCRLTPAAGSWEGPAVHVVALTIAATLDRPLPERAEAVRQAVFRAAARVLGLAVTAVDLEINAVLEPADLPGGRRFEPSRR
ncbi:hypothetical protein [Streptomyces sp. NPDC089799]|uniref:hypothetical protein n=1 Tax=Streptomyces sp. NPDC089799 TaxID=3155066 RepID=UPI003427778A